MNTNKKVSKMKIVAVVVMLALMCMMLSACFAGCQNRVAQNGTIVGQTNADYIVVNYSGGEIFDVYKLRDTFVNNQSESDGIGFRVNGGYVTIQGDAKMIRCEGANAGLWDKYLEYHKEFDGGTYFDFTKKSRIEGE